MFWLLFSCYYSITQKTAALKSVSVSTANQEVQFIRQQGCVVVSTVIEGCEFENLSYIWGSNSSNSGIAIFYWNI